MQVPNLTSHSSKPPKMTFIIPNSNPQAFLIQISFAPQKQPRQGINSWTRSDVFHLGWLELVSWQPEFRNYSKSNNRGRHLSHWSIIIITSFSGAWSDLGRGWRESRIDGAMTHAPTPFAVQPADKSVLRWKLLLSRFPPENSGKAGAKGINRPGALFFWSSHRESRI